MMKKRALNFWKSVWVALYLVLLVVNFFWAGSAVAKVVSCAAIGLNVPFAIYYARKEWMLWMAMLFTFFADVALALNSFVYMGVFIFVFAQFFHFLRLSKSRLHHALVFLVILTLMIGASAILEVEPIFVVGAIYAMLLGTNLYISLRWFRRTRTIRSLYSALGFTLFVLCDLCVASSYFSRIGLLPLGVYPVADFCSWIFYYPSQILIVNSGRKMLKN